MLLQILSQILENAQFDFAITIGVLSFVLLWLNDLGD